MPKQELSPSLLYSLAPGWEVMRVRRYEAGEVTYRQDITPDEPWRIRGVIRNAEPENRPAHDLMVHTVESRAELEARTSESPARELPRDRVEVWLVVTQPR